MKKTGRNDPCPCGSGKKFKKCCEATLLGGRYKTAIVDATSAPKIALASRLTGLFQTQMASIPVPLKILEERPVAQPISGEADLELAQVTIAPKEELEQKGDI